ncbi:MAG: IS200/IS605 family transposase [Armatimonadetes bacterium]|nr:IS200/IS605 family transposase [Armatimonadota bacterium]
MRRSKVDVYLHLVWGTFDRLPLVQPEIERRLYRNLVAEARSCRCKVLAIGGTADHVHMVIKLAATVAVAVLLKQMKGVSSDFAREQLLHQDYFKWHGGYSAFSVTRTHLSRVIEYVKNQKQHHADGTIHQAWEEIDEEVTDDTDEFEDVEL